MEENENGGVALEFELPLLDYSLNEAKPFKCKVCTKSFKKNNQLNKHIQTHSTKKSAANKKLQCSYCPSTFAQKRSLKNHEDMQHNKNFKPKEKCVVCEKLFYTKDKLRRHMFLHSGRKPHECQYCEKHFADKSNLKSHLQTHEKNPKFVCEICEKKFAKNLSLQNHIKAHNGERDFTCDVCNKGFTNNDHLTSHMTVHLDEKPFQCPICGNIYRLKYLVLSHIRRKHKTEPDVSLSYL